MSGKKLNVLSLDLRSSESHKSLPHQRALSRECSEPFTQPLAVQSPSLDTAAVVKVDSISSHSIPPPSTVIQMGLTTPATPTFPGELKGEVNTNNLPSHAKKCCAETFMGSPDDMDQFSFEEFEQRYQPLSNLPTPPIYESCTIDDEPVVDNSKDNLDPRFYAPAKYLASMIPQKASRNPPSVKDLHEILQKANLRLEIVSLACCVLDCLSARFLRKWRLECRNNKGFPEQSEVLAIGALSIAMKFLEDTSYTVRQWSKIICSHLFPTTSLALTERLILADLNYCVLGISSPELLEENIVGIKRIEATSTNSGIKTPTSEVSEDSSYISEMPLPSKTTFPLYGY